MNFVSAATKLPRIRRQPTDNRKQHLDMSMIRIARAMWMEGSGTKLISLALRCTEAAVWNNMDRIKGR